MADDGKRFDAVDVLFLSTGGYEGRESEGGDGVKRFAGLGGWRKPWRMTGSALTRWTLHLEPEAMKGEGVRGRGVGTGFSGAVLRGKPGG